MQLTTLVAVLALTATGLAKPCKTPKMTKIAGVEVVDTQMVRDAQELISKFPPYLYHHCMRTWLYGAAVINANETLRNSVDLEAHALGTTLHDLGWDMSPDSPWVSETNRFEVDGALGALKFIQTHETFHKKEWSDVRLERVFDGIALHGTPGIHPFKNIDSMWITASVGYDGVNTVPEDVPSEDYKNIIAEFPQVDFQKGAIDTFTWLAKTKPEASYNNFVQDFGTYRVEGFNATGHRNYDRIVAGYMG